MKPRIILTISLLVFMLLVGCVPAATTEATQPVHVENEPEATPAAMPTVTQPEAAPTETPSVDVSPTEASTVVPQVIATSRGPNLEATNPDSYMRASGDLQLVEFFAFW